MHGKTLTTLLAFGFSSDLIEKIEKTRHTVGELRAMSRQKLLQSYTPSEVDAIKARIDRTPIDEKVILKVVAAAGRVCCFCADGIDTRPFQIHHIDPYSETQDNSEDNLLFVCPTHHAVIHETMLSRPEQKSLRRRWSALVEIASSFKTKNVLFPFGAFQALDYDTLAAPSELVQFAPLSPSTTLECYPRELADRAQVRLDSVSALVVLGASGSGKTTYATALAGLQRKAGFQVFRYRFDRQHNGLQEVMLFISMCVRKAVLILDDANTWATITDLQQIAKLAAQQKCVRIISTWTTEDSNFTALLQASDLPKQTLLWADLRPAVVEALLSHEADVVEALQAFESRRSFGALGVGSRQSRLGERIMMLGDGPKTVYEFIFGLRGDGAALDEEFSELVQSDRADVATLQVAIEQIAGFEVAISVEEVVARCQPIEADLRVPSTTEGWVRSVLDQQVKKRRLVRVRDRYTTIHRRWAAKLIAAGLRSHAAKASTEALLRPHFVIKWPEPERLLRLWNWLKWSDQDEGFVQRWEKSLKPEDWTHFVGLCATRSLAVLGSLAREMHIRFRGDAWKALVGEAFTKNSPEISALVHGLTENDWYSLRQISMAMEYACLETWRGILQSWDVEAIAKTLLKTQINQFDNVWWALGKAKEYLPGWLEKIGEHLSWEDFSNILDTAKPGDLESLFKAFTVFEMFTHQVRRSMYRRLVSVGKTILSEVSLDDLELPFGVDKHLLLLLMFFPQDGRAMFGAVDTRRIGQELSESLPRHWKTLAELSMWTSYCESDIPTRIVESCDLKKLKIQVRRFGPSNRFELRLLFHFLSSGTRGKPADALAFDLKDIVRVACEPKDSEASSILSAFRRLSADTALQIAKELQIELPEQAPTRSVPDFETRRMQFEQMDAANKDYDLEWEDSDKESVNPDAAGHQPGESMRA